MGIMSLLIPVNYSIQINEEYNTIPPGNWHLEIYWFDEFCYR